jgi:HD-like signal output (HDOD) protein
MRQVYALALQDNRATRPQPNPDPAQMSLLLAASRAFAQIGTEPRYTPRRPSLLPQLLEALSDEDASLRAMSRIVSQDPQLTGDLLRTANSALYRVSSAPIESVERATAMLGTTGLRTLISAALVQPLATGTSAGLGRFGEIIWEHALYSASAAEAWAGRSQDTDPFTAHLLALMHGLGCVAVYRVLTDLYAAQPELQPDAAGMADALETNAGVTAARIATHWGLSERTRLALEAQSSAAPVSDPSALAVALQFGLLTGAMTLLCKQGILPAEMALERIVAAGFPGAPAERIWERMQRAYVRPQG